MLTYYDKLILRVLKENQYTVFLLY